MLIILGKATSIENTAIKVLSSFFSLEFPDGNRQGVSFLEVYEI